MAPTHEAASDLFVSLVKLMKMFHGMRQHAPRAHPAVDTMAYPLLFNLKEEPRRVSALADCVHSDVSTVSRQVSHLVAHGLLEKVTDPEDGRAQVVTLSAEGKALLATLTSLRTDWFLTMLEDWSTQEARDFQHHILRFTAALEASRARATAKATARPDGDAAGIPSLETS